MINTKIKLFEKQILKFYKCKGRKHLPWRSKNITPYKVWVSEIMLQQTQVDRVIDFYKRFIKRFPTVTALAEVSWEEFLLYYQGLGYYNRGRNMLKTAKVVKNKYRGTYPRTKEGLMQLPGIGEYTASAILSFSHNHNHLAWDTNFQRVFGRFFYGSKEGEIKKERFEKAIKANKRDFNGAIMDFGSLVCVKQPKCHECSLVSKCLYFKEQGKQEYTVKIKKNSFPTKDAGVHVFLHKDHKEYYSKNKKTYAPFKLSQEHNSRDMIKKYFLEKYNLHVSVRPPYKKLYVEDKPVMYVHAQILSGKHHFNIFTKQEVGDSIK